MSTPMDAPHNPPSQGPEEEQLVRRLLEGDGTAYERLVRTYSGSLLATARRFLGDEEDARDVLQETFLAAFNKLATFRGSSRLSTWIQRILINICLMKLRTRKRADKTTLDSLLPDYLADGHRRVPENDWRTSVEGLLHHQELRRFILGAIKRLPEKYRNVLLLRDIEEVSTLGSAQLLNITENAVKLRLHRARQALRTLLAERLGDYIP